jgi:ABC-type antimicrobial peptide transport system permease subunit
VGAVWQLAVSELRRRWRGVVVLVLLVGAVGAIVLATAAGARRTSTALARFNSTSRAATVQLQQIPIPTAGELAAFGRVPEVASFGLASGMYVLDPKDPNLTIVSEPNTQIGTVVDRARVIAGRAANPAAVDEVAIDESVAAQTHLGIGDHLDVASYAPRQMAVALRGGDPGPPAGPRVSLRIVGLVRRPFDLGRRGAIGGITILTPAFYRAYSGRIGTYGGGSIRVRTRNGLPDIPQIKAAALRIFGSSSGLSVTDPATEAGGAQDAINVLTIALWIIAGVIAAAGAVAIGIVLTREIALPTFEQETLRALGMTRFQRRAVSAPRAFIVAVGGAVVAVVAAAAASGLFPVGIARMAEPDPGVRIDGPVLALGFAATAVAVLAIAFVATVRNRRDVAGEADAPISRRAAGLAAQAGLAPTLTNGLRMALERGRGRTAVPVRSAFVGAVLGVFGVTAVLVFSSNLQHLVTSPRSYGWNWDFSAPDNTTASPNSCIRSDYGLLKQPGVGALASVCEQTNNITLDGNQTTGWSFTSLRGTIEPEIVAGRPPASPLEVALGATTMDTLAKHIGDTVEAAGPHAKRQYRIVGQAAFPTLGQVQPLADGAAFTGAGFAPLFDPNNFYRYLIGDFTPNANRAAVEHWIASTPKYFSPATVPSLPVEIDRVHQIDWLPTILGILLGVLALIAVGHALVTSVRRRRRELALLKTLGFKRQQVRTTIAWQATTIATIALLIGIPAGLVAGRQVWELIADSLGVTNTSTIPTLALVLVIPATIALVNLVAFFPARSAAHTRPATALRSE